MILSLRDYLVDHSQITEKDYREADAKFNDEPSIAKFIERCQDAVLKEFQGDFPVARINYFAVYSLCVEILQRMTTSGHQPETVCTCYLAPFLRAVDEYVEDGHVVKTFKERHMLRHMKDDLTEVMKNKTLSDFLWET